MKQDGERGAVAMLAACAMAVVLMMALGLHAMVQGGARGSAEFMQETRLRLLAEGQAEKLAREIELAPSLLDDLPQDKWQPYGAARSEKGMRVTAALRRVPARQGTGEEIYLKAWAEPEEKPEWRKGKIVCAYLHREGDKCVWRGWRAADDGTGATAAGH